MTASKSRSSSPTAAAPLVVGELDAVPEAAGGRALRIVVCDAQVRALPVR